MTQSERTAKHKDTVIPNAAIKRPFTKAELTMKLPSIGVTATENKTQLKKSTENMEFRYLTMHQRLYLDWRETERDVASAAGTWTHRS